MAGLFGFLVRGPVAKARLFFHFNFPFCEAIIAQQAARQTLSLNRILVLVAITVTAPLGDTFLDIGMKRLPPIQGNPVWPLIHAVTTPWVAAGILMLLVWFGSQISALAWADLSYLLPVTSFGNVILALLARFVRHESISPLRWLGIALITAAVGFVARGPSYTEPEAEATSSEARP